MSSLGIRLCELREAKGVSLDDIARSTRIGRRQLEALETDSWGELPAPVFVKGFIRAYCEFLDVSPDEALGLYRGALGEPVKPARVASAAHTLPSRRASSSVASPRLRNSEPGPASDPICSRLRGLFFVVAAQGRKTKPRSQDKLPCKTEE